MFWPRPFVLTLYGEVEPYLAFRLPHVCEEFPSGFDGNETGADGPHAADTGEHAPPAAAFTDFHEQDIRTCHQVNFEIVLEITSTAVDGVCVNDFTVEPDFDGVIATYLRRETPS